MNLKMYVSKNMYFCLKKYVMCTNVKSYCLQLDNLNRSRWSYVTCDFMSYISYVRDKTYQFSLDFCWKYNKMPQNDLTSLSVCSFTETSTLPLLENRKTDNRLL